MRVNRRFLYWGVFLAAIGGVLVATDLGRVEAATIVNALRLWPLGVIAIGLGLALRRTRFSLPGGLLAVAVPGLLLGGGLAVVPRIAVDCSDDGARGTMAIHEGSFDGPARVSVLAGCGDLVVSTALGNAWRLEASDTTIRAPIVDASRQSLSIDAGGAEGWRGFAEGWRDFDTTYGAWQLTLPTSSIENLSFEVSAGEGRIDLPGAQVGHLNLTTNAARMSVDLSGAYVPSLSGEVNAGMLSVRLSDALDLAGSVEVNAGAPQVCAPDGLGLRVHHTGALGSFSVSGRHQDGSNWQSLDYASATHRAELKVDVNLGNVEINPIGGCK